MATLARRLGPAAALGGLAIVIVGVADPALAGHDDAPRTVAAGADEADAAVGSVAPDAAAPASCDSPQEVSGQVAMTRWGPVQVTATVAAGRVCEVHAVNWPTGDGKSVAINAYAIPRLDAMATQSPTQFDYVSGATYTSQGYHDSLQSILDSL